jgi:hypothetical protein
MAVINLPTMEQMDVHNTLLASIASHTGTDGITVSNWEDVQRLVRMGLHTKMFTAGDQFQTTYDSNPFTKDVIGLNHDIPTDKKYTNSLTLQFHDCLDNAQFSAPQALYNAETGLPAGTHIFTLNDLKYSFTTTEPIPIGGVAFAHTWSEPYIPGKITTYAADRITVVEADIAVTTSEGVPTLTVINHHSRCRYGSNDYAKSAIRQWLNSEETIFKWKAQGLYDMPPTDEIYTGAGYLKRLDPELLAVLGAVDKQVAKSTIDGGGQDLFNDKVFLLSRVEVFGGDEGTVTGESPYSYYSAMAGSPTTNAIEGRIKYLGVTARYWWLRSPGVTNSHIPRNVYQTGNVNYSGANYANGLAPACCIV